VGAPRAFVGIVARRPPSHISSRNGRLYPVRSCARWRILAALRQQAPPRRSWHWGRTKSGVGGTSKRPRNSDKVARTKAESVEGWPAERGKKQVEVPHPAGRVFAARRLSRLGRSGARPLTNFTFWGRLPPKYAGRATRTERELNVD
jgi:hypothetical protein